MNERLWDTMSNVRIDRSGPGAIITMDRPTKRNAMNYAMIEELTHALLRLEQLDDVRGIVLTGSDVCFSAGADLHEALQVMTPADYETYNRRWRDLTSTIEGLWKPVIAAIEGFCLTGGLEVALACDIRIAGVGVELGITSSKIGSVAGVGGTQRLPRVIGRSAAKRMLFSAKFLTADEALSIGLVDEVVESGCAVKAALEEIAGYVDRGPLSIAWHKMAVNKGMEIDLESALDLEASLSSQAFSTKDKEEGMSAFFEKRSPKFIGQ